jgi:hypothetical protein
MKSADIIFWHEEPISFGIGLCEQLLRHQLCHAAIAMPHGYAETLDILRKSRADCVVFISPHMHEDFLRLHLKELKELGKPLLGYVSEWVAGNEVFPEVRNFHKEMDWLDYYGAAQMSDARWFRELGMKCDLAPPMFANELFPPAPSFFHRRRDICYIGHNNAWKTERLRILEALDKERLLKGFTAPRNVVGANSVAALFREFSAVLCPPAHGRGHSIRCYEAAASGALIVECQPLDDGNEYFIDGKHRISFPVGLPDQEICDFIRSIDYDRCASIAKAGSKLAHDQFAGHVGFARFLSMAEQALTVTQ